MREIIVTLFTAAAASAATSAASKATSAAAASTSATATGAKRGKFKNILSLPYLYSKSVVVQITNQNEINDDDDADDDDEFDGYENTRVETNGVNEYGINDEEIENAHQGRHFLDDDDASQSDADYNSAGTGAYAKKSELRVIENEIIIDKDLAKKKAAPVNVDNAEDNCTSNIVNFTDLFITNQLQMSRTVTTTASTSNSNFSNVNVLKLNHEASISINSPAQTSSRPSNSCTTSISTSSLRSPSFSGTQTETTPSTLHSLRNEALTLLVAPLQTMKSSPTALTDEFFNSLQTTNSQDDKIDKNVRIVNQSSSLYSSSSSSSLSPSRRNSKTGACDNSAGYSFAGMRMVGEMERRSLPLDDKRISRDENINDIFGDDNNNNNFYNNNDNIKNTNTSKNNNVTNEDVEKRRIKFSDGQHSENGESSRNDVDRKNISSEFCRNYDVNNRHADECQSLMNDDDEDDGYCLSLAVKS
ncbi:hypothetical protein HELRODRAFT_160599 [Helobdella robusta]|uniref:Uncharacterized protein n=1 Tax=Helobdella robusta TaxID=6412 RepID=T1EQH0_HELRO|nr:hypothetical protein HELRODRAFT_160599 [Helobdella robusta]ESO06430.1 hypothetical protein HELRODRAFT_160599 [Helobdella robusta]